jgi:hypothetical protein
MSLQIVLDMNLSVESASGLFHPPSFIPHPSVSPALPFFFGGAAAAVLGG